MRYESGMTTGRLRDRERADAFLQAEREKQGRKEAAEKQCLDDTVAEFDQAQKERIALTRKLIERGERDPEFVIPQSVLGLNMPVYAANEFNKAQALIFREQSAEFREQYNTPENIRLILDFLLGQGIQIADSECFRLAFDRLRELGLLVKSQPVVNSEVDDRKLAEEISPRETADSYAARIGLRRARPEEPRPSKNGYVEADGWDPKLTADQNAERLRIRRARIFSR